MFVLTHIFLHNWHHIRQKLIPFEQGVCKPLEHQQDWDALFAAIRLVLVADIEATLGNIPMSDTILSPLTTTSSEEETSSLLSESPNPTIQLAEHDSADSASSSDAIIPEHSNTVSPMLSESSNRTVRLADDEIAVSAPTVNLADDDVTAPNPTMRLADDDVTAPNPTMRLADDDMTAPNPTMRLADDDEAMSVPTKYLSDNDVTAPNPTVRLAESDKDVSNTPSDQLSTAYVALEFHDTTAPSNGYDTDVIDTDRPSKKTLGACVECREGASPVVLFFSIEAPLDPELLVPDETPLDKRQLRQTLRTMPEARTYREAESYRASLLSFLGNLNERFFDVFLRGISFEPLRHIQTFVRQWLLEERPIDMQTLHHLAEPYARLSANARDIEERLLALRSIIQRQRDIQHVQTQYEQYMVVIALLQNTLAERNVVRIKEQLVDLSERIEQAQDTLETVQAQQKEMQATKEELEIKLRQTHFMFRQDELQREIREATSEANIIQSRWLALVHDLKKEEAVIRPLINKSTIHIASTTITIFTPEEHEQIRKLLDKLSELTPNKPPERSLQGLIEHSLPLLNTALTRAQEAYYAAHHEHDEIQHRLREQQLHKSILEKGGRHYPDHVERACTLLLHVFGERPPLLCEVLEVPDNRWQDAVEAMLGNQRFTILVQSTQLKIALQVLERARVNEGLCGVGILDVTGITRHVRPPLEGSLAFQVHPLFPSLRPFVDTLLGDVIACETMEQLYRYRNGVTPEVVRYRDGVLHTLSPNKYRPWFIGKRLQQPHIETLTKEIQQIEEHLKVIAKKVDVLKEIRNRLLHVRAWERLVQRLDAPLDERPLRAQTEDAIARQRSLDTNEVDSLHSEIEQLQERMTHAQEQKQTMLANLAGWQVHANEATRHLQESRRVLRQCEEKTNEVRAKYPHALPVAKELLLDYLPKTGNEQGEGNDIIYNLERTARGFETRMAREMRQLIHETTAYNTRYFFDAETDNVSEQRYEQEEQRLITQELPHYKDQIQAARREVIEGLRDDVLYHMRDRFQMVSQQIRRLNESLERLDLEGVRYHFRYAPDEELQAYYDIITQSQALHNGPVLENEWYLAYRPVFDQFYTLLTRKPQSHDQQYEQNRLLDYRSYFHYDIEIRQTDGSTAHIGKGYAPESDSTRLVPLYLIIASSFAHLYHMSERSGTPTIRLVAFQHAFAGMSRENINTLLNIFDQLGLQVIFPEST